MCINCVFINFVYIYTFMSHNDAYRTHSPQLQGIKKYSLSYIFILMVVIVGVTDSQCLKNVNAKLSTCHVKLNVTAVSVSLMTRRSGVKIITIIK